MKSPLVGLVVAGLMVGGFARAQDSSIMIERLDHYRQINASTPTALQQGEYQFQIRIQGDGADLSTWAPAFFKPDSDNTPDMSPNLSTNTGRNNFSAEPNDNGNFRFQHNFDDAPSLLAAYPTGSYGVVFDGLSGVTATSGLTFAGAGFVQPPPQITAVDNGAFWSAGLVVQSAGVTKLTLNSDAFAGYTDSPFGALIQVTLYDTCGHEVDFQQSINVNGFGNDEALDHYALDGASLVTGQTYTLEVQYGVAAGAPGFTTINETSFLGAALYYTNTVIAVTVVGAPIPEPATYASLLGAIALLASATRRKNQPARG